MIASMLRRRSRTMVLAGATTLVLTGVVGPSQAVPVAPRDVGCVEPGSASAGARGGREGLDHRDLTAAERAAVERRTAKILAEQRRTQGPGAGRVGATVPVYVHVMMDANGNGNVTPEQVTAQVAVLNKTFGGAESTTASDTGFDFALAGTDRFYNTQWHQDKQSSTYRSKTRQGGANALNIWLVDFGYLGVATFPWDYARSPRIDGIRVNVNSLPSGTITNYNLGETATHEAGHWLGLYHTFQGGCTTTNDSVGDTPAQGSPTNGCPAGRDSCTLPGLDPIHNYMDYSFDSCYTEFSAGQTTRAQQMFSAYRA